jgi:hypothetical protein
MGELEVVGVGVDETFGPVDFTLSQDERALMIKTTIENL